MLLEGLESDQEIELLQKILDKFGVLSGHEEIYMAKLFYEELGVLEAMVNRILEGRGENYAEIHEGFNKALGPVQATKFDVIKHHKYSSQKPSELETFEEILSSNGIEFMQDYEIDNVVFQYYLPKQKAFFQFFGTSLSSFDGIPCGNMCIFEQFVSQNFKSQKLQLINIEKFILVDNKENMILKMIQS